MKLKFNTKGLLRLLHSLRFQLPAVLMGLFVLILGLWVLLFREVSSITGKTRQLNYSAEASDHVTEWSSQVAASARERTKFMSLSKESYLDAFVSASDGLEVNFHLIQKIPLRKETPVWKSLNEFHELNQDYQSHAKTYAAEWRSQELLRQNLLEDLRRPVPMIMVKSPAAAVESRSPARTKVTQSGNSNKGNAAATARRGYGASKGKAKTKKPVAINRPAKPMKSIPAPSPVALRGRQEKVAALEALYRRQQLRDSTSIEYFRTVEAKLRDGLGQIQEELRSERMQKQATLGETINRAKQRLIYSLVLLTLMIAYVAYILQWKILDPINNLEYGAIQIGRGSLGFKVKVDSRSEIGHLAAVFNTMSERLEHQRDDEMRLRKLDAIQQLVRSVNHEINNPLMIISGNAEYLLATTNDNDDGTKDKLNTIVGEVRRIFQVTQQLKEIKEPVTTNYTSHSEPMIDLVRSSQVMDRRG